MKWSEIKAVLNPAPCNGLAKIDETIKEGETLRQKRKEQEARFLQELRALEQGLTDANPRH